MGLCGNFSQTTFNIWSNFRNLLTDAFHFHTPLGLRELDEALRLQTSLFGRLGTYAPSPACSFVRKFRSVLGPKVTVGLHIQSRKERTVKLY